jgi:hypothetical protein
MDKKEAIKRLDALEEEASKLRKIIEEPEVLVYDPDNVYVAIIEGIPYLLAVNSGNKGYARWHSWRSNAPTQHGWSMDHGTGQAALDYVSRDCINVFRNAREGIEYFYQEYMKA